MDKEKDIPEYATAQISEEEKAEFRLIFCKAAGHFHSKLEIPQFKGDKGQFLFTYSQGLKYKSQGFYNGALRVFFLLQEDNPFFWGLYRNVGVIYGMQGKDEDHAVEYLTFSNELLGNQDINLLVEGIYYKALLYSHQNKYDDALSEINKVINLPNFKEFSLSGNIFYLGVLNSILKLKIDKAEAWAKEAIEIGQANSSLLLIMANYYLSNYMNDRAYEYHKKALELIDKRKAFIPWVDTVVNSESFSKQLNVEKHAALAGIANHFELNGNVEDAIKYYNKALEIHEHSFSSNIGLASIYASLGDSIKMKSYLSQGIEYFDPNNPAHQIVINSLIVNDNFRNKYLRDEMLELLVDKRLIHRYLYRQVKKIKFTGAEQELEELLVLISKGEIKQTLSILLSKIPYNSYDSLIQLNSRYSRLITDNHSGVLSRDEYERELNKIIKALIDFIGGEIEKVKL